ncbi:MAG: T9SS type A sorting domain-containing protein [Crocinitomicaceae bacterium]
MSKIRLTAILFFITLNISAQSVTNGNFNSGGTGWGCSPETNPVSTYGGTGSNTVAEVDAAAGLCQTVSGFTIGSFYQITFQCSRRTTCGPTTQSLNFSISGAAFTTQSVVRTGGGFNFTTETFAFIANSTSLTFTFQGTSAGTCGLILDNIVVSLVSPLSIKLLNFNAHLVNNEIVQLDWQTASEANNDYFTIERSQSGHDWEAIAKVDGAGNSATILNYSTKDNKPYYGVSYYRLKQTDFDGKFTYSEIKSVDIKSLKNNYIDIYPNPTSNQITIVGDETELRDLIVYDILGQNLTAFTKHLMDNGTKLIIDLSELSTGTYYIKTKTTTNKVCKL